MNESREQGLWDGRGEPGPRELVPGREVSGEDVRAPRGEGREAGVRGRQADGPAGVHGRGRWLQAGVAERLLNGEDMGAAHPRAAELAVLLAAVRDLPPGRPRDEVAALDAFRRAVGAGPATASGPASAVGGRRRRTVRGTRSARMLLGGAVAVFTVSGVAIAAQGGDLPHPFHTRSASHEPSASASSPWAGSSSAVTGPPSAPSSASGSATPRTGAGVPLPPATVSPSPGAPGEEGTKGLCEAYAKAQRNGKKPDKTSQARLAEAAGGVTGIDAYCAALTATPAPGHPKKSVGPHLTTTPLPITVPATPKSAAVTPSLAPYK
ncbi:hypothetical protein AB0M29_17520 [Streptomyces sp. NPDC051976]|uniref:hypothetical protein n=1 Tax=Streptomyces sp. NPDC051976 TaxID=3154947 RepID=UPI00341D1CCB